MRPAAEPGPVFVVGAPRSGVGILTWSLGQHPSIDVVRTSGWIARVSRDLAAAYQEGTEAAGPSGRAFSSPSLDAFLKEFGPPVQAVLGRRTPRGISSNGDPEQREPGAGTRWVTGNPDHSLYIYGLSRLFPDARFIHVLRGVEPVVRSLVNSATPDGTYFTEESAFDAWLRCVRACVDAERALGTRSMIRIRHADLVADPERTLLRCLAFLEESFHPACLRPVRGLEPDSQEEQRDGTRDGDPENGTVRTEARRLWLSLRGQKVCNQSPDRGALTAVLRQFDACGSTARSVLGPASSAQRLRDFARATTPEGSTVLVVSRGDPDLTRIPGREGWHFPQNDEGVYAGHYPEDSAEAVDHLQTLRERGADLLLIPCTAFWWLDHYDGLRAYLASHCRLVAYHEDTGIVFALRRSPAEGGVQLMPMREEVR